MTEKVIEKEWHITEKWPEMPCGVVCFQDDHILKKAEDKRCFILHWMNFFTFDF